MKLEAGGKPSTWQSERTYCTNVRRSKDILLATFVKKRDIVKECSQAPTLKKKIGFMNETLYAESHSDHSERNKTIKNVK